MKITKFLSLAFFITLFALFYVYQQTEIVRLAYIGQKKSSVFTDLLDKNAFLRYNIGKSTSLVRLGEKILSADSYEMPGTYKLVKISHPLESIKLSQHIDKKENLFARLFGIKRQAEAHTVSPSVLLGTRIKSKE